MKDHKGDKTSVFATLGASNHSGKEREIRDYYATPPELVERLLERETFGKIWEPACGEGHISKTLKNHGYDVYSSDKYDRRFGDIKDFLTEKEQWNGDIITNPPYAHALDFVKKALELIPENRKVAMLVKIQFLEGKKRKEYFEKNPPKRVYIFSERRDCWPNGVKPEKDVKAICYMWAIWEKGYSGPPQVFWI